MATPAKRRAISGSYGLTTNYISTENGTSTAANSFTGVYVWVAQYATMRVTVNSDKSGTITFRFSDDGTTSRSYISDSTVGGTPYFRSLDLQSGYARVEWTQTGGTPTTLFIYTAFSKNEGVMSAGPTGLYVAGTGISITGSAAPYTIAETVALTGGTGISVTGTNPNFTVTNTSPDQTVALTGGTGISVTGTYPNFTLTNTAPDQTVGLTAGTGISVTGTYPNFTINETVALTAGTGISVTGTNPNFTITNSKPDQTVAFTNGTGISVTGTYPNFTIAETVALTAGSGITITGSNPSWTIASTSGGAGKQYISSVITETPRATSYYMLEGVLSGGSSMGTTMPCAGTFSNLYLQIIDSTNISTTITVYKNGVATSMAVTLSSASSGNDTTHSFTVAAGDKVSYYNLSSIGGANHYACLSMVFTPS